MAFHKAFKNILSQQPLSWEVCFKLLSEADEFFLAANSSSDALFESFVNYSTCNFILVLL